jgi:hypothetical protein
MTTLSPPFPSSELSRNSGSVFTATEASPVLITGRDGEDLVPVTQRNAGAINDGLQATQTDWLESPELVDQPL